MVQKRIESFGDESNDVEIAYLDADQTDITFYGQMDKPVHRWFRLTAAYSPQLVDRCLSVFAKRRRVDTVLDPFCGTGTTLVESRFRGRDAIGVEYNPVYYRVSSAKTSWPIDIDEFVQDRAQLNDIISSNVAAYRQIDLDNFESELGESLPNIYNLDRWWQDYVLKDLIAIRSAINSVEMNDTHRRLFNVALAAILVEVSNATYNHVSLSYMDEPPENVDVIGEFKSKVRQITADFTAVTKHDTEGSARVINGDSTEITDHLAENAADTVITSPPYPNRYSYVRETRPHMFFFDLVDDADEVGEIALDSVGGTWGRATSQLEDTEIEWENETVKDVVSGVAKDLSREDESMRNYVVKYFNMMENHLSGIETVLTDDAKVAYTVGNSTLKGVEVQTDILLGRLFQRHGFDDVEITRARERNSKSELYEAIVYGYR